MADERGSTSPASSIDSESEITLGLLTAIEENESLTQRSVASQLGIALGLTNAYLKRCVKKGLIKVKQIPPNRYAYYLTPQGFAEKSRLTAEYLSSSFTFFRRARRQCGDEFDLAAARGWHRVALYGLSDLAEIAVLCAAEHDVTLVGVVDPSARRSSFFGRPVAASIADLGGADAVMVTDLRNPQNAYDRLAKEIAPDRVLTPHMLHVKPRPAAGSTSSGGTEA